MKTVTFTAPAGKYEFCKQEAIVFRAAQELETATVEELAAKCMELGLETKQDPERIVAYYLVDLKKKGFVTVDGARASRKEVVVVTA